MKEQKSGCSLFIEWAAERHGVCYDKGQGSCLT